MLKLTKKQWDSMPKSKKGVISSAVSRTRPRAQYPGRLSEDSSSVGLRTLIVNGKMLIEGMQFEIEGQSSSWDDFSLI